MILKQFKQRFKKIFYGLIKINELKLFIYENNRLNTKSYGTEKVLSDKILSTKNYLRDLKCSKLSCTTEIKCIQQELYQNASIIIQYYYRMYITKLKRKTPLKKTDLENRYLVRKNYIELNNDYKIYLSKLETKLSEVTKSIDSYSELTNKRSYEKLILKKNNILFLRNQNKEDNNKYLLNIKFLKDKLCKEFDFIFNQLIHLDSLDRMELNEYLLRLQDNKTKYCTVQLENILTKTLSKSLYSQKEFNTFVLTF